VGREKVGEKRREHVRRTDARVQKSDINTQTLLLKGQWKRKREAQNAALLVVVLVVVVVISLT
jgi:hypothetical protein